MATVNIVDLERVESILPWRDQWDALARDSGRLVFQSSAWFAAWWSILEPEAEVSLLMHAGAEGIDGIFAVGRVRRRFHRRFRAAVTYAGIAGGGMGAADHLGPVASSPHAARALLRTTMTAAGGLPILLANVAPDFQEAAEGLPGARVVTTSECPRVELAEVERVETLWSASRRGDIRRCRRRLREAGFTQSWTRYDGVDHSQFHQLVGLHRRLWTSRGREGVLGTRKQAFLSDVAARLADTEGADAAWIQTFGNDDEVIGAMLAFQFGRTMCSYATGWDPDYRRLGLGILLEVGGLEFAADQGLERYDFLRGTEQHKYDLGGSVETDVTYCVPTGPRGVALFVRDRLLEHHRPRWQELRAEWKAGRQSDS